MFQSNKREHILAKLFERRFLHLTFFGQCIMNSELMFFKLHK